MGAFTIYVYSIFTIFEYPPTPGLQLFTFDQPPTYCKRLHLEFDHPQQYVPNFAQFCTRRLKFS